MAPCRKTNKCCKVKCCCTQSIFKKKHSRPRAVSEVKDKDRVRVLKDIRDQQSLIVKIDGLSRNPEKKREAQEALAIRRQAEKEIFRLEGDTSYGDIRPASMFRFTATRSDVGLKRCAEDDCEQEAKRLAPLNDTMGAQLAAMKMKSGSNSMQMGITTGLGIGGSGKACTEEIHIPDCLVGLIIGRGGEQISKIQAETGCNVQFAPEPNPGKDRAYYLQEKKDLVMDIVTTKGHSSMRSGGQGGMDKSFGAPCGGDGSTIDMIIPGPKVGLIIGEDGETIRLQDKSGTKMYILQETLFGECDKPLRIVGEPDLDEHARLLVLELITDTLPKQNFPSKSISEYGSGCIFHGRRSCGVSLDNMKFPAPKVSVGLTNLTSRSLPNFFKPSSNNNENITSPPPSRTGSQQKSWMLSDIDIYQFYL